jgi:hypothetical protein
LKNLCIVAAFRYGQHTGDNHADVCTNNNADDYACPEIHKVPPDNLGVTL